MGSPEPLRKVRFYEYVLLYFYLLIVTILGVAALFMTRSALRLFFFDLALKNGGRMFAFAGLLEKFVVVFAGIAVLSYIIIIQDYFYKGIDKNILCKRFIKVLGNGLLVVFVLNCFVLLFYPYKPVLLFYPGIELIIGLMLTVYSSRALRKCTSEGHDV